MKVHQFLDHYGITDNPFAQEDAQADRIFQDYCLTGTHHSAWDKVFGDPKVPATSVVFGEQGSGKTALRLQIVRRTQEYNLKTPMQRAFIIEYDDFNPFLDTFRESLSGSRRKPDKALQNWRLWDHMDAILTLATTRLANAIRNGGTDAKDLSHNIAPENIEKLSRTQRRDLLLLAAFYDNNRDLAPLTRWGRLRSKLKFLSLQRHLNWIIGGVVTIAMIAAGRWYAKGWTTAMPTYWWMWAGIVAGWLPYATHLLRRQWQGWRISKQIRIVEHRVGVLRNILGKFNRSDYLGQPIPSRPRGDDRYELISKLQGVLETLGFSSLLVLVDRVDEPHLINGSAERMRDLIWPLFDNKFLKHPGMAFKLLLPSAVSGFLNRQEREFYEKSRLDKQNMIPSLLWTGQQLYDIANARVKACAKLADGKAPNVREFFDPSISDQELIGIFDRLRAPRHLFKFMYRVLVDHCSKYTEDQPIWKIRPETLQSTLSLFLRDLDAYDRKQGTG